MAVYSLYLCLINSIGTIQNPCYVNAISCFNLAAYMTMLTNIMFQMVTYRVYDPVDKLLFQWLNFWPHNQISCFKLAASSMAMLINLLQIQQCKWSIWPLWKHTLWPCFTTITVSNTINNKFSKYFYIICIQLLQILQISGFLHTSHVEKPLLFHF